MSKEKALEAISDDLEIIDILKVISSTKEKVWLWQNSGERNAYFAIVKKVDPIRKVVQVHPTSQKGFNFPSKENLYLYSSNKLIATKLKILEIGKDYLVFALPKKISRVTESFVEGLQFVEKENEEANLHKRDHNRSEVQGEKLVSLRIKGETKRVSYSLNDISVGGFSFKVDDPGEFDKGDEVEVFKMNEKDINPSMRGVIMSIKEMPEVKNQFKVGIKFI